MGVTLLTWWVLATPSFKGVGDLLQKTDSVISVLVWAAYIVAFMGLIDLFIAKRMTVRIVTLFWVTWSVEVALARNIDSGLKIVVWIIGFALALGVSLAWTVIIETMVLLYSEVVTPHQNKL